MQQRSLAGHRETRDFFSYIDMKRDFVSKLLQSPAETFIYQTSIPVQVSFFK